MPDHDLFDLYAAFADLERDIAGVSSPRGAGLAVSTARRRRTTLGAAAAVLVIATGATGGGILIHRHSDAVGPSAPPAPAALTLAALTAATTGWIDGWETPTKDSQLSHQLDSLGCLATKPATNALDNPTKRGITLYSTPAGQVGFLVGLEYNSATLPASTAADALASAVAGCHPTVTTPTSYDGATVIFYEIPATQGQSDVQMWTVQLGDRVAYLAIGGGSDAPSNDTVGRVDDSLVSAVQADATFTNNTAPGLATSSASASSSSSVQFDNLSVPQLTAAFGTWDSGLEPGGATQMPTTPCDLSTADATTLSTDGSQGSTVGSNGVFSVLDFDSAESAATGLQQEIDGWRSCQSARYTVSTVEVPGQGTVTVATTGGARPATSWAVRSGEYLAVLSIKGGSSPPTSVSEAVGALVYDVLGHPLAPAKVHNAPAKVPPSSSSSTSAVPKN